MSLNLFHVSFKCVIEKFERLLLLGLQLRRFRSVGVKLLHVPRIQKSEEILKLIDIVRIRPKELPELPKVIFEDELKELASALIRLLHCLLHDGFKLFLIHWAEME